MPFSHQVLEDAAREVLETTAGTSVRDVAYAEQDNGHRVAEVVATLSLYGKWGGTLVMHCNRAQAAAFCDAMLGEGSGESEETIRDLGGELLNQIAGTIKRRVGANGDEIMLSPPVVVTGSPLSHSVKSSTQPLTVLLELPLGTLGVSLWLS